MGSTTESVAGAQNRQSAAVLDGHVLAPRPAGRSTALHILAFPCNKRMAIRILVTGGTFDKEYDELTGRLFFRDTHLPEMLRLGRSRVPLSIETIMMIDSLDLDDAGRAGIVARAATCAEKQVVITHGTDTMVQTAHALAAAGLRDKTVVLTGAMVPYAFGSSDGLFNLGSALSFVQVLAPGVYVAMNGRHFGWDAVRKNTETGCFEPV